MNNSYTETMLQTAADFVSLGNDLSRVAGTLEAIERYNPREELYKLVRRAEVDTVQLRDLAARTDRSKILQFYGEVSEALNIEIKEYPDWLRISLPVILPKRNRSYEQDFLLVPMRHALIEFLRKNPRERMRLSTVCIVHQYDASKSPRRVRDYDNIETKRYLDVIEALFLSNDSGLNISVYQCTELGDADATVFYLMQPDALPEWLTNRADGEVSLPEKERNGEADQQGENGDREAAGQPDQSEGGQPWDQYKSISEEEIFS
ncbi:MAG: hypothetical protein IKN89_03710 [Oscillospiraceae bacterium]|nr:hypothetical protein [Oscillospiraceae bacterium]